MKCWICGKEDAHRSYPIDEILFQPKDDSLKRREKIKENRVYVEGETISPRMFCNECYQKRTAELQDMRKQYGKLKKSLMLERAVKKLERQAVNIYDYQEIINDLAEYVAENPEKFDSSYEMIAAIILIENGIKSKIHYKVGTRQVDFLIPEYKVAFEVDGELHKNNLFRDNERDIQIRENLGMDWEVVRISTNYLDENAPALPDAIVAVRDEKKKIRAQHNGFLPDWYSARNKAKRKRAQSFGDDFLLD